MLGFLLKKFLKNKDYRPDAHLLNIPNELIFIKYYIIIIIIIIINIIIR